MSKGIATPAAAALAAKPYPAGNQADDFDAKQDMLTLVAANKIKADKGRHSKAKAAAKAHMAHLKNIVKDKGMPVTTGDGASGDAGMDD